MAEHFNFMDYANKPAPARAERDATLARAWAELSAGKTPDQLLALRDSPAPVAKDGFVPYTRDGFHRRLALRFLDTAQSS